MWRFLCVSLGALNAASAFSISSVNVIDSTTNTPVLGLNVGSLNKIDLHVTPQWNIDVITDIAPSYVIFRIDGTKYQKEAQGPYALCGDLNGQFYACPLGEGTFTLSVKAFLDSSTSVTADFEIEVYDSSGNVNSPTSTSVSNIPTPTTTTAEPTTTPPVSLYHAWYADASADTIVEEIFEKIEIKNEDSWNIIATSEDPNTAYVVFFLNTWKFKTEKGEPYAFCGDSKGDYNDCSLKVKTHELDVVFYDSQDAVLHTLSIELTITSDEEEVVDDSDPRAFNLTGECVDANGTYLEQSYLDIPFIYFEIEDFELGEDSLWIRNSSIERNRAVEYYAWKGIQTGGTVRNTLPESVIENTLSYDVEFRTPGYYAFTCNTKQASEVLEFESDEYNDFWFAIREIDDIVGNAAEYETASRSWSRYHKAFKSDGFNVDTRYADGKNPIIQITQQGKLTVEILGRSPEFGMDACAFIYMSDSDPGSYWNLPTATVTENFPLMACALFPEIYAACSSSMAHEHLDSYSKRCENVIPW